MKKIELASVFIASDPLRYLVLLPNSDPQNEELESSRPCHWEL